MDCHRYCKKFWTWSESILAVFKLWFRPGWILTMSRTFCGICDSPPVNLVIVFRSIHGFLSVDGFLYILGVRFRRVYRNIFSMLFKISVAEVFVRATFFVVVYYSSSSGLCYGFVMVQNVFVCFDFISGILQPRAIWKSNRPLRKT